MLLLAGIDSPLFLYATGYLVLRHDLRYFYIFFFNAVQVHALLKAEDP